jgi:hypothetical protein
MPLVGIYVDNDYVTGFTTIEQREERQITQIITVPTILAFDLDGLIKIWKATRTLRVLSPYWFYSLNLNQSGLALRRLSTLTACDANAL